jgi:multidrug efflux system membrane fusion protein
MRRFAIARRAAGILALGLAALAACGRGEQGPPPRPPVPVAVATAVTGTVPIAIAANGYVEPVADRGRAAAGRGADHRRALREGDEVREGQVLFEIDRGPRAPRSRQAQALVARDRATAAAARADAAALRAARSRRATSRSRRPSSSGPPAEAIAGTIAGRRGGRRRGAPRPELRHHPRADLGQDGRAERAPRQPGARPPTGAARDHQRGGAGARALPVPERALQEVRSAERAGRRLEVVITGAAVGGATERGVVDFVDNVVDTVSGSVTLKARFANADRRLWPGAFVPLTLTLGETPNAVLVPSVAVQQGPQGATCSRPTRRARRAGAGHRRARGGRPVGDLGGRRGGRPRGRRRPVAALPGRRHEIARTVDARVPQGAPGAARAADAERVAAAAGAAATTAGN